MAYIGIENPLDFRIITRAHIIAWRDDLEKRGRTKLLEDGTVDFVPTSHATVRRKLSDPTTNSMFTYRATPLNATYEEIDNLGPPIFSINRRLTDD